MNARTQHVLLNLLTPIAISVSVSLAQAAEAKPMKFARFQVGNRVAFGVVEGDRLREISGDLFGKWKTTDKTHALKDVELLVPTEPSKVMALAGNYKTHLSTLDEKETEIPEKFRIPQGFFKAPSCLVPQGANVVIPPGTEEVHYEAELVLVIGKRAKNVPKEKALDFLFGVTCGNDISARDWQKADVQWWRAKASDTFGPCGPFIVRGVDYGNLMVRLRLNGEVRQEQSTKDFINDIPTTISFLSRHVTLEPGDLIYTGTPGETSAIKPGDVMEVDIENVGVLRNRVRAAK